MRYLIQPILFFLKKYWDAIAASAVIFFWILLYTQHSGIGISPDSVAYISAAENIANSLSFTDFNQQPFVLFPLGYPIFLALVKWGFFMPIIKVVPLLNAFIFSGDVLIVSYILQHINKTNTVVRILLLLFIICSPALIEVYTMLWSETLFLLLVLLFFITLKKYLSNTSLKYLVTTTLIAAIACTVRYAGISFLLTGGMLILIHPNLPFKSKWKQVLFFELGAVIPVLINIIRNAAVSGTYTGVREKATRGLAENVQDMGSVLSNWFPLPQTIPAIAIGLIISIGLVCIAWIVFRFLQPQYFASFETIIATFILLYGGFMLVIASVSRFETLSSRLLSPLYIPLLLLISTLSILLIQHKHKIIRITIIVLLMLGYGYTHAYFYKTNALTWEGVETAGIPGYTEDQWKHSSMINYLQSHKNSIQQPIYSNANDAVFFLTQIHAHALPHKDIPAELTTFLQMQGFYLIWFYDGQNDDLINVDYIQQYFKTKARWQFKDGIILSF